MVQKCLKERLLPDLLSGADGENWSLRRKELLKTLSEEVYGVTPEFDTELYSYVEVREEEAFGGKAVSEWIRLSFMTPNGMYSFPFQLLLPKIEGPLPAFVHIAFQRKEQISLQPAGLNEYMPVEEVLDRGYAVANLFYEDVTSDTPERDGLALAYPCDGGSAWGKLGMWAFAASRIMDYLLTRGEIDGTRVAVGGWSRLGKTALWCGAQDERFSLVISTESGCSGAALQRGKKGETVRDITSRFGYWFCPAYAGYGDKENEMVFDQHFLLACIAPRALFVGSAEEDLWADPESEFLGAVAASEAYHLLGESGIVMPGGDPMAVPEAFPEPDQMLLEGRIGYMMRRGGHGMSRTDWLAHMMFREMHGA